MTDVQQHATEIHEQFSDTLDISVEEVEERLDTLINEYRVPAEEARRSVTSSYLDEADMDREELGGDSEERMIESIEVPEQWVDLTVEVLQLWEPMSESVAQVGLLGDETGTIKFTKWAKSDLPELEEGGTYRLENLVTDEYEGQFSVKLNRTTSIEEVDEEIDVPESGGDSEEREIGEIDTPEEWVDLTAKVTQLWEPRSESIAQVGLLGDETSTIKFTAWATSDLPELEEGSVYRLENVVTDEYEGDFSVKLNRTTTIEERDDELEVPESGGDSEDREVGSIDAPEEWVNITAKITQLWEPRSESVGQVGLLGDPSGTLKFTKWAKSDLPELEEGAVYRLENVVTDEYEGDFSVKLNRTTTIEELDEEIEVGDDAIAVEGALVDIQRGSGLIKRCPEDDCTRVLQNGRCSEHGEVEGEFDLRVKAVIDDGNEVHETIFNQEATEEFAGISLDEAKEMAMDALDTTVVADEIRGDVLGSYYRIKGPTLGRYVLANEFEVLGGPTDAEETLIKARSLP